MIDAFIQIRHDEGLKALYSGCVQLVIQICGKLSAITHFTSSPVGKRSIWPAVLRQAIYGTIKFGTYYSLKRIAQEEGLLTDRNGNERVWCNVLLAVTGKAMGGLKITRI